MKEPPLIGMLQCVVGCGEGLQDFKKLNCMQFRVETIGIQEVIKVMTQAEISLRRRGRGGAGLSMTLDPLTVQ